MSRKIKLPNGMTTIVDNDDYKWASTFKWQARGRAGYYYAVRPIEHKHYKSLHREIMNAGRGQLVDHINHDTLDNRKRNLRICSTSQNSFNKRPINNPNKKSKHKGVAKSGRKWIARIQQHGKRIHIGRFNSEIEAAEAVDRAAFYYHGEFAYFNFPNRMDGLTNKVSMAELVSFLESSEIYLNQEMAHRIKAYGIKR